MAKERSKTPKFASAALTARAEVPARECKAFARVLLAAKNWVVDAWDVAKTLATLLFAECEEEWWTFRRERDERGRK